MLTHVESAEPPHEFGAIASPMLTEARCIETRKKATTGSTEIVVFWVASNKNGGPMGCETW